jgi:hypothetical protein
VAAETDGGTADSSKAGLYSERDDHLLDTLQLRLLVEIVGLLPVFVRSKVTSWD